MSPPFLQVHPLSGFSVFLQRDRAGVLHHPVQHGVGEDQGQRVAHHLRPLLLPVRHRGPAHQGKAGTTRLIHSAR